MQRIVDIKLNKEITLQVKGHYTKAEEDIGLKEDFYIENLKLIKGEIADIIEYFDILRSKDINYAAKECFTGFPSLWDLITDKCLEVINNES